MKFCVGLTGGIGCGKSTVSELFAQQGAGIIDTDVMAHQLTQNHGEAIPAIRSMFGGEYLADDGALNRAKMRSLIFRDASAKQRLEKLLHPLILDRTREQIRLSQDAPYLVIVVPLLLTSPQFRQLVQRVLVVDCAEVTQVARVMARNKMREVEVRAVMEQQTPRLERLQQADDVINNDSTPDNLTEQVNILHRMYLTQNNN